MMMGRLILKSLYVILIGLLRRLEVEPLLLWVITIIIRVLRGRNMIMMRRVLRSRNKACHLLRL